MKSPTKPRAKAVRFNLFFLEMIIVLLFFSIAAAVILSSFSASNRLANKSRRTEAMAFCAQSTAEIFSETGSLSKTVEELFGVEIGDADDVKLTLDEDCEYSLQNYEITMTLSEAAEQLNGGTLKILFIIFEDINGEELYRITSGAYVPNEWRAANE